jgi:hypothetical protein
MRLTGASLSAQLSHYTVARKRPRLARDTARNFADEDRTPALAFRRSFSRLLAIYSIFILTDILCKAVINQRGVLKPQFLVPGAVVYFRCKDLLKGAARKIVWPVWHQAILSSERRDFIRRRGNGSVEEYAKFAARPPAEARRCKLKLAPPSFFMALGGPQANGHSIEEHAKIRRTTAG